MEHGSTTTEAIVEGIGVDTIEDGVGIMALVQEVGEFETKDEAFQLILNRGVEKRHTLIGVDGDLPAHMVIV